MSAPSPWYRRWANDWLGSPRRAAMRLADQGCYQNMLDLQWVLGGLPDDVGELVSMVGADAKADQVSRLLSRFFARGDDGLWRNAKMHAEREVALRRSDSARNAAVTRHSADRMRTAVRTACEPDCEPQCGPHADRSPRAGASGSESESVKTPPDPPASGGAPPSRSRRRKQTDPVRAAALADWNALAGWMADRTKRGHYRDQPFGPALRLAVDAIGGIKRLVQLDARDLAFARNEFVDAYAPTAETGAAEPRPEPPITAEDLA